MTAIGTLRNTTKDTLREVLTRLQTEGAALGHFNVADHVLLKAVIAAASETKLPVFVGASEGEREFFGARQLAALVKSLRQESDVPVFLNADSPSLSGRPLRLSAVLRMPTTKDTPLPCFGVSQALSSSEWRYAWSL